MATRKKKTFFAAERDDPERLLYYREFCRRVVRTPAERLLFLDESFCKTGMRREHARSLRGSRVVGTKPGRNWKTLSLIGAIRLGRAPCLMTNRGSVNGKIFLRFVRRHLLRTLRPGDVLVMDNLNFHKMKVVREAIESVGATPLYLPTYSPELNPIELWWGDVKRELRRLRIDAQELLEDTVCVFRRHLSTDSDAT